ncbi:MAG: dockerin type I repeat-containing protein, partial [bacterium]
TWYIDSDHKLIWDGEPYVPYTFTGTGTGEGGSDPIGWFQANGFDRMSLAIPEDYVYQTPSQRASSVAAFDSLTDAITQAGLTYSAGLNFFLPPIHMVDSSEAVGYLRRQVMDVTELAGETTDLTIEVSMWIKDYWYAGDTDCWLFNFTDRTAAEVPDEQITVNRGVGEESDYYIVELTDVSFPASDSLVLFVGIQIKIRYLAISFGNGGNWSVELQLGGIPPLWQPGVKAFYLDLLSDFAEAYAKEGLRNLAFGDEISIFPVDFMSPLYPVFGADTIAMNAYHAWLEDGYGTISAFNDSLQTDYPDFDSIPWRLPISPYLTVEDAPPDSITETFGLFSSLGQELAFDNLQDEFRLHLLGSSFAEYGDMTQSLVGEVPIFITAPGAPDTWNAVQIYRAALAAGIDGLNMNPYGHIYDDLLYTGIGELDYPGRRFQLENFFQAVEEGQQETGLTKAYWTNEFHYTQLGDEGVYFEFPSEQHMREFLTILVNNGLKGFHFFLMDPGEEVFAEQVGWYADLKSEIIGMVTGVDTSYSYFRVGIHGQPSTPEYEYTVATSDSELIAQCQAQLALPEDQRTLHINGALDWGDGGFNGPWNWHIVPDDWVLAEASIEVCDGLPQDVEGDLDYWINTVGRFCCWSSFIKSQIKLGDVNRDGEINVLDVVQAVNIILEIGDPPTDYELWAADFNQDGLVNILDVVLIVNEILGTRGGKR